MMGTYADERKRYLESRAAFVDNRQMIFNEVTNLVDEVFHNTNGTDSDWKVVVNYIPEMYLRYQLPVSGLMFPNFAVVEYPNPFSDAIWVCSSTDKGRISVVAAKVISTNILSTRWNFKLEREYLVKYLKSALHFLYT